MEENILLILYYYSTDKITILEILKSVSCYERTYIKLTIIYGKSNFMNLK